MTTEELIAKALTRLDIPGLNHIQEEAFQAIQAEKNTMLIAPTGSGKTLAFLLPILQLMEAEKTGVQCLILSPTRELAIQIESVWKQMSTGFKVNTCYGGHSMTVETQNLSHPPALLIGTPGRVLDHLKRETFSTEGIRILVLDEFDKSLNMGFQEQMSEIILALKDLEKRVLVSATDRVVIPDFTGIQEPKVLNYTFEEDKPTDGLTLKTVISPQKDKIETLFKLLCHIGAVPTLIFVNHRESAERTSELLDEMGIDNAFFHGGMEQPDREKTLVKFRNGSITFLVASDLAARGLDIPEVRNVIHYHFPSKKEDFLHRNGRTARMYAEGTAYLLLGSEEKLPVYMEETPQILALPKEHTLPPAAPWATLYISGGKKDKISKSDIVGFLSQKGKLGKDDLGKVEVMDFMSFAAVRRELVHDVVAAVQQEKMKGKKYRVGVAR